MKSIRNRCIVKVLTITLIIALNCTTHIKAEASGKLKVHFIDVGDADCILIQQDDKAMLIDAGNNTDEKLVKSYLEKQGVSKLEIVIGTHVDEDHIGSLDAVINEFQTNKLYMPKCDIVTRDIENVMKAANEKGLELSQPVSEESFKLGEAVCTFLAPVSRGYEKLNNYSVVMKVQYKNTSFLFTGDAEGVSEREMMRRGLDLTANVLKLGHHGSIRSTTNEFLERVNPKYAVIMVGKNNNYRHPHKRTMEKLKTRKIEVYRTDENGTVIAESDGENITFNKKPGSYNYR